MEELLAKVMGVESVKLGKTGLAVSGWWGEGTPYRDLAGDSRPGARPWCTPTGDRSTRRGPSGTASAPPACSARWAGSRRLSTTR